MHFHPSKVTNKFFFNIYVAFEFMDFNITLNLLKTKKRPL